MAMLSNIAAQALSRPGFQDFMRANDEFEARKKQRILQEQLGQLQLQKLQKEMQAPKLPFQGNSWDAQIANEAYKFNLGKGMSDATARQSAIDMVQSGKIDYHPVTDPYTGQTTFQATPRNAIFGSSAPSPQKTQSARTGINPEAIQILKAHQDMAQGRTQPPPSPEQGGMQGLYDNAGIDPNAIHSLKVQQDMAQAAYKAKLDEELKLRGEKRKGQEEQKQNLNAYNAFSIGAQNVKERMSETFTNPVTGALPALTPAQQGAEGSVSVMAPILKQLFRTAGEGTFTDKDQELLMDMLPTRDDWPSVRDQKLKTIDEIVRAKLGIGGDQAQPTSGNIIRWEDLP